MTRRAALIGAAASAAGAGGRPVAAAMESPAVELPPPQQRGGMPLNDALMLRRPGRMHLSRCRRNCCPTCYGRQMASIARRPVTEQRPIGDTSW